MQEPEGAQSPSKSPRNIALAVIVLALALVIVVSKNSSGPRQTCGVDSGAASEVSSAVENPDDTYKAALASGKPIYVLFHSTTCAPCIEMAKVCNQVLPKHKDKLAFIDVITNDPISETIVNRFQISTIPTSIFIANGKVVDSYVGAMSAEQLSGYLAKVEK